MIFENKTQTRINLLYILITLILFMILAYCFVIPNKVATFNLYLYNYLSPWISDSLTKKMIFISNMGSWYIYGPIVSILILSPKTRYDYGIPLFFILLFSVLLNLFAKLYFMIPRPELNHLVPESGYGFPSGHSMNAISFVGFFAFLLQIHLKNRWLKIIGIFFATVFIIAMGISRVYLGVHNPTDIIGAYLLGFAVINFGIILFKPYTIP